MGVFQGHRDLVRALQWDREYRIVSGSYDATVKVWDIRRLHQVTEEAMTSEGLVADLNLGHQSK